MKVKERKSIWLKRRYLRIPTKTKRMQKHNGYMRESLYAKIDRKVDRMRVGLKDLIPDTLGIRRCRTTVPDCPKQRWV